MKPKILPLIFLFFFLLFKVLPSFAVTTNWIGATSTNWGTASNWSNGVPSSTADVTIGNIASVYQPSITAAATAKSIMLGTSNPATLAVGNTLTVSGNITVRTYGTLNTNNVVTCVTMSVNSGGTLMVNGSVFTSNYSITTLLLAAGSIVEYSSTAIDQTISSSFTYSTLRVSGTGSIKTLIANLPPLQSASGAGIGTIEVLSGTFDLAAFLADRGTTATGGTLTVSNGAFLKIGGTNTFPANYLFNSLSTGSTIEYDGGNQIVSPQLYGNLVLSSSSGDVIKMMPTIPFTIGGSLTSNKGPGNSVSYSAASDINIAGSVNISASTTFYGVTFSHSVGGIWNNNGTFISGSSSIKLIGGSTGISGNMFQDFYNLVDSGSVNLHNSGTIQVQNLVVTDGLNINLILYHTTLRIAGTVNVSNSAHFDASSGTIEMNGVVTQSIPTHTLVGNAIDNLIISNTSLAGVILDGPIDIFGSLTYTIDGIKLTTNDSLTLKSTATKTAWVGDMTGKTIIGMVTVERYISAEKAWYHVAVPNNTIQTVKAAWQEGAIVTTSNPLPGYGTQITSDLPAWFGTGFDAQSLAPSMKIYSPATDSWIGILNTNSTGIQSARGYMLFVRGERTADNVGSEPTETVLRTNGYLYSGNQDTIFFLANLFASVGNPYASPVDMRNIMSSGLKDFFYVWDPRLGGNNGFGAYQTFSKNEEDDYVITPGDGSYTEAGSASNYINSGQAFFVQAGNTDGYLAFNEAAKTNGASQSSIISGSHPPQLRTSLYGINKDNTASMVDGVVINFNDNYSNRVDDMDAVKRLNTGENLSIKTSDKLLVIERRQIMATDDTIFLNLANAKIQQYRFKFTGTHLAQQGVNPFLEDNYLHTITSLDPGGNTIVDFSVENIPASYAVNRFRITFKPLAVLDCRFTSVKAAQANKDIKIEWKVENELNIIEYVIEKSKNGMQFTNLSATRPTLNSEPSPVYIITDIHAFEGYNYYRIKSVDQKEKTKYTHIVKVWMGKGRHGITIYPNPVVNGVIGIQLNNMQAGKYAVILLNNSGEKMFDKIIDHAEGSSTEFMAMDKSMPHGTYQLQIIKPGNEIVTHNLIH
ncbi:MAG: hypothetical protein ABI416_05445 [Ginsengibacter sp.]